MAKTQKPFLLIATDRPRPWTKQCYNEGRWWDYWADWVPRGSAALGSCWSELYQNLNHPSWVQSQHNLRPDIMSKHLDTRSASMSMLRTLCVWLKPGKSIWLHTIIISWACPLWIVLQRSKHRGEARNSTCYSYKKHWQARWKKSLNPSRGTKCTHPMNHHRNHLHCQYSMP